MMIKEKGQLKALSSAKFQPKKRSLQFGKKKKSPILGPITKMHYFQKQVSTFFSKKKMAFYVLNSPLFLKVLTL